MAPTISRVLSLALLGLLMACGGPARAPQEGAGAALSEPGPSWIAGSRAAPTAGRLVVGLLVERRDPVRLADLLPPGRLQLWYATQPKAPPRSDVVVESEWWGALERTWGPQAALLRGAAQGLQGERGVAVEFREVLADEVRGIPLVLVGTRRLHAQERSQLEPYRAAGGRLLQLGRETVPQAPISDTEAVLRALRGVLAESPLVHVLARDPLAATAQRDGDDVVVALPAAGARVRLEDGAGARLAEATTDARGLVRLRAPDPELDPFLHRLVATWQGEGLALQRAWTVADLAGTVETVVEAGDSVQAGGVLALRVRAYVRRPQGDEQPVPGRKGRAELVRDGTVLASAAYATGDDGYAAPVLALPPEVAPGGATLRCDRLERAVLVVSGLRLSVVCDRPLYQPTDTVLVRLMAHRAGDGRPVPGQAVELSLGDAKCTVTTSGHGIASHAFRLEDARVGPSAVQAQADGAEARCAFRVKAFERPTFTVEAEPAALELRAGESAPVVLTARYVNGTPFVGGTVSVDASHVALAARPRGFDAEGRLELVVTAAGHAGGALAVAVQDAEGRRMELSVPVGAREEGVEVDLRPLSDLAVGVPARFQVLCSESGVVRLGGDLRGPQAVEVGADGAAEVELTPTKARGLLRLIPADGGAREFRLAAREETPDAPLVMALDRRAARVGDTLGLELRSGTHGGRGLVLLEVWRDGAPVRTLTARMAKGMARVGLPLDASLAGVLQVQACFADDLARACRSVVLVTRGRALAVEARAEREQHAPGSTARVDVRVTDAQGAPTAAVLGYWGVDEALLALAPPTTGHERVFDVAPPVASRQAQALAAAEDADRGVPVAVADVDAAFAQATIPTGPALRFPTRVERTPALRQAAQGAAFGRVGAGLARLWDAYGAAWKDLPVTELMRADSLREVLQWLVRRGRLDPALLLDPWGTPYALWSDRRNVDITWQSAGPDTVFGTADDLQRAWDGSDLYWTLPDTVRAFHVFVREHHDPTRLREPVVKDERPGDLVETDNDLPFEESFGVAGAVWEGPADNGTIGIGGGAGGAFRGRGGRAYGGGAGGASSGRTPPPLYVRKDFAPTLCFVPEAIVGPEGTTRLEIPLKDSITTWRLRLVASAADGATGVGEGRLRVGQDVHAAPWLAPHLTVGDVVDLPVAVRNELPHAVTARVALALGEQLAGLSASEVEVGIPARGTGRAVFRLEARAPGAARVRVLVDAGEARDLQERVVTVHRDARPVVASVSGSVVSDAAFPVALAAAGPGEVRLELHPSPLAEVVSGFDGLIAAPHG